MRVLEGEMWYVVFSFNLISFFQIGISTIYISKADQFKGIMALRKSGNVDFCHLSFW